MRPITISAVILGLNVAPCWSEAMSGWQWSVTDKQMYNYIQEGYAVLGTTIFSGKEIHGNLSGRITSGSVPTEYAEKKYVAEWEEIYLLQKDKVLVRCVEYHLRDSSKRHFIKNNCAELGQPAS